MVTSDTTGTGTSPEEGAEAGNSSGQYNVKIGTSFRGIVAQSEERLSKAKAKAEEIDEVKKNYGGVGGEGAAEEEGDPDGDWGI